MTTPPELPPLAPDATTRDSPTWRRFNILIVLGLLAFAAAVFTSAEQIADWRFAIHQTAALEQAQKISDGVADQLQLPVHAGLTALAMAEYKATLADGQGDPVETTHNDKLIQQLNQGGFGLSRIRIATADGRLLSSPTGSFTTGPVPAGSIAGRGFYKTIASAFATTNGQAVVAIGRTLVQNPSGPGAILLARGIGGDSGKLTGIVILELDTNPLTELIRSSRVRRGGSFSRLGLIRLDDGATLAGVPMPADDRDVHSLLPRMRRDANGELAHLGIAGSPAHIVAWSRLNPLPLAVYVSRDADPVMLPATREVLLIRLAAGGIVLVAILAAALAWRVVAHQRTRTALALARAAQDATEAAHAEMEQSIENLPAAIYRCDILPDDTYFITYISKNANEALGPNMLQRDKPGFWVTNAMPEDHDIVAAFRKRARKTGSATQEYRLANPEGGFTWVRHIARYLSRNPDGSGSVVGSLENIDEEVCLREQVMQNRIDNEMASVSAAYETLNSLLIDLPIAVVRVRCHADDRLEPQFHSAGAAKVVGPPPPGVEDPLRLTERISPEDRRRVHDAILQMRTGQSFPTMEVACNAADGRIRWLRIHAYPTAHHPDGSFDYIGTLIDISEERQNRIRTEINTRLSTLGEMATGIAHELNQPLFLITMAAENAVLEAQKEAPNRGYLAQNLDRVLTQAMRASKIVEHLQSFTRQDQEREEPVSLAAAIEGACSLVGGMLQQWQIELHVDLPATLPPILGQPTRIEQVLVNLLLNARDALNATPVGQRRITISATAGASTVQLRVADSGAGVPEEILQRIFEPFFTTKGPNTGSGLGLSICHGAMRTMGGEISVDKNPTGGAVFTLTFRTAETITQAA